MTSRAEERLRAVFAPPVSDRAAVAVELLASLDEPAESDRQAVGEAWASEIERRVVAGESAGESWSDVRTRLTPST